MEGVVMASLETGRVCMKLFGREAGCYCVVVKPAGSAKQDRSFVTVTGPKLLTGVKRRKANISHLKSTEHKLEISEDADDAAVIAAYDKAGLTTKLGLKKPSAAEMKAREQKAAQKAEAAKKAKPEQKKGKGK